MVFLRNVQFCGVIDVRKLVIKQLTVVCKTVLPKTSHSAEKREIKPMKINLVQIETESEIGNRDSQKFIGARVAEKIPEIKFPVKYSRIDEEWTIKNKKKSQAVAQDVTLGIVVSERI